MPCLLSTFCNNLEFLAPRISSENICTHQLCQLGKRHCSPDLTGLYPFEGYPVPLLVDEWIKILPIQKKRRKKRKTEPHDPTTGSSYIMACL